MTISTEQRPQDPRAAQYDRKDLWVVFDSPSDYPGRVVARRYEQTTRPPRHEPAFEPTTEKVVAATIEEARRAIPAGRGQFPRLPNDAAEVAEVWL
ncbi:hypothetical protein [Ferrovibrio terrae]|uniref:hypothetical protein n=1 Tax=Ferrovibrio terrae TaxID=2594003 RepID=UPI003137EF34